MDVRWLVTGAPCTVAQPVATFEPDSVIESIIGAIAEDDRCSWLAPVVQAAWGSRGWSDDGQDSMLAGLPADAAERSP
ncbi:MAG: hypothetical protein JWO74_4104 [Solirubrobacterales bacterium]|nr:hypothetical protein [Solirubrobacterales bacterium]